MKMKKPLQNPLTQLMERYRKGNRSTFHLGPFLSIAGLRERRLSFNDVFRDAETMTAAALMSFELGFESTVVPFDLNVEAEILGARVSYHDGFEGHPVYPTIAHRPIRTPEDVANSVDIRTGGRMPAILHTIGSLKESCSDQGAIGAFMPGPFTLAGQVMEPEQLFIMLLKKPDQARGILARLTEFLSGLKSVYAAAGVDFLVVEEGGAVSVSPRIFGRMILPNLKVLFEEKPCPMAVSLVGGTDQFLDFLPACGPDADSHRQPVRYSRRKGKNPRHPASFYRLRRPMTCWPVPTRESHHGNGTSPSGPRRHGRGAAGGYLSTGQNGKYRRFYTGRPRIPTGNFSSRILALTGRVEVPYLIQGMMKGF